MNWIFDLLITYTHHSELQRNTSPLLISKLHSSLQYPLSVFQPSVLSSRSLATAAKSWDSSASRDQILLSLHRSSCLLSGLFLDPEDEGNMFLRNTCKLTPDYMVSLHKMLFFIVTTVRMSYLIRLRKSYSCHIHKRQNSMTLRHTIHQQNISRVSLLPTLACHCLTNCLIFK
jgi:hypothetical protein